MKLHCTTASTHHLYDGLSENFVNVCTPLSSSRPAESAMENPVASD